MGLRPDEFWKLTYAEFIAMLDGFTRRRTQTNNDLLYVSWHVAAFNRQKTLPSLKSILVENPTEHHQQTDEEMLAMIKIINAAFGGKVVEQ